MKFILAKRRLVTTQLTPHVETAPVTVQIAERPASIGNWRIRVVLAAVLVCHVALVWPARIPGVLTGQDDATYILLGRALSQGWYRELWRVDAPVHSQYPPGYPAVLALLEAIAGPSQTARMALSVTFTTATLLVLYAALRRRVMTGVAVASVAVLAVNPYFVQYGGEVATELPYTFMSVACLYALVRSEDAREQGRTRASHAWLGAAGIAMVGAALVRTIGIALIVAVDLWLALKRRWKAAAVLCVAGASTFGVWLMWTVLAPEQFVGRSYIADVLDNPGPSFLATLVQRILGNAWLYLHSLPWAIAVPTIQGTIFDNVVGLLVLGITLPTGLYVLWHQWRTAALYAVTYTVVLLVFRWQATRFLVPLLALLVPSLLLGAVSLARSFRPQWMHPVLVVFTLLLVWGSASRSVELIAQNDCPRHEGIPLPECARWPEQARYFDALRFVQSNLPQNAVFLTAKLGALNYYTGRKSISLQSARVQRPGDFIPWLKQQGVSHILLSALANSERGLLPSLHANCERLQLIKSFTPTTLLFVVDPPTRSIGNEADVEDSACDAIRKWDALQAGSIHSYGEGGL